MKEVRNKMGAILKKEFKAYFLTPVGYVFIGLFLILFSMFFNIDVLADGFSILSIYFIQAHHY